MNSAGQEPANSHLSIRIRIPGEPGSQGRPRFVRIGEGVRTYDPKKSRDAKSAIAAAMDEAVGAHNVYGNQRELGRVMPFIDDCVRLIIVAAWSCPKGEHRKRVLRPLRWRPKKPDIDNVVKLAMDAGNGIWWHDDNQIVKIEASKLTLIQGMAAYTEIIAFPMGLVV